MKITWVTRSFLDYRIPVYEAINTLCKNNLTVVYFKDVVPERCQNKLEAILGNRAIGLTGEMRIGGKKNQPLSNLKNNGLRIPIQPGLIKTIKSTKPDIILADGFFQWTYAALWLKIFNGIPNIMLYEGTEHTERNAGKIRLFYRKLASRFIDTIHCNGGLCVDFLKNVLKIKSRKLALGNMTSDTESLKGNCEAFSQEDRLAFKKELNLQGDVFLFVGRLVPLKGVRYLIEVWKKTKPQNSNLLLVGDGPLKDELSEYVIDNKIENVYFTGAINYDFIYKYFAISDAFIIPTLQDNWSLVVPEAMSCGLPIISSKYNGCWPELVKPENGWVLDPLDEKNFEETLEKTIENKDDWKQMGEASAKIIADFSPEKIASQIFKTSEKIIADK